jgi:hypothetical protein
MCCLLLNGDPGRTSSFEPSFLRRHRAFVRFPINDVSILSKQLQKEGALMDESLGIWYLRRDRLFFDFEEDPDTSPEVNGFEVSRLAIPPQGHPRTPTNENRDSFTWALDMQKVFPRFSVDKRLLSPTPPERSLAAQVIIDRGKVRTKSTTRAVWDYDPTLSGNHYQQVFAHEIMVRYTKLASARITAVNFDNPTRRKFLDLTSLERGGELEIEIVNTCDVNPLQWPKDDDEPVPDEDTKWFFELIAPDLQDEIRTRLEGRPLPIPRPVKIPDDNIGAPGSGNCIPPRLTSTPFSFEELDGAGFMCDEA